MATAKEHLASWTRKYFENRNLYLHNIRDIKDTEQGLDIIYKDKTVSFFIMPSLEPETFLSKAQDKKGNYGIACYNTKENLQQLIGSWSVLTAYPSLSVYFVNPFADGDTRWIIRPKVHDQVTEKASLKLGLQTLFEGVAETSLKHVEHMAAKA
ncbi:MAG: hypothetical protein GXP63_04355 [DPANN group archaeon]|nr:hypothetical protein [DPANN group archaeon]